MMLDTLLSTHQEAIVEEWIQQILQTYPEDAQKYFKRVKNRFANPVGQTFFRVVPDIFAGLARGQDPAQLAPLMEELIRIRAVQDSSPSRSLAFILTLKQVLRKVLEARHQNPEAATLEAFDRRVDALLLSACDIFVRCREKLAEIRINEAKKQTAMLLKNLNRRREHKE